MKIVVCGSRTIEDAPYIKACLDKSKFRPSMTGIITGGAGGVDTIAYWWARFNGLPCSVYRAQWSTHGRAAGPIRNHKMAIECDGVIAIWDGKSRGTDNMISQAEKAGKSVEIWTRTSDTII
jgi:hypothetical protein